MDKAPKYRVRIRKAKGTNGELTKLYQNSEYSQENLGLNSAEKNTAAEQITEQIKNSSDFVSNGEAPKKHGKEQAAKHLMLRHRIMHIIAYTVLGIALVIGAFFFLRKESDQSESELAEKQALTPDEIYYSPLTGNTLTSADMISAPVTCIMIENSPEARPQSGLRDAGIIYEAIAEGGITRFLAIYQESKPQYVGPVRSVRLTFAELAKQYNCSLAHVGGAPNALDEVRNIHNGYRDMDVFFYEGEYFWRDSERAAPHNVYTSFEKIDALNRALDYTSSSFTGFLRAKPDTNTRVETHDATTINISISSATFNPEYHYDENSNQYLRSYANGEIHNDIDADGNETQYSPDVVIAMSTTGYTRKGSTEGYLDYTTTNSNEAYVFQNGTVTVGYWKRSTIDDPLKFYDSDGNEIPLNRGQVWISAYPSDSGSVTWK